MKRIIIGCICIIIFGGCSKNLSYQYHALVFTTEETSYQVSVIENDFMKIQKVHNGDFSLSINTKSQKEENKIVVERLSGNDTIWIASDIDPVATLDMKNIVADKFYEPYNLYQMRKKRIEYDYSKAFKMYCIALLPGENRAELEIKRYGRVN